MLFWLWYYLDIKIDIYQVHNELCILKSSKNSSICTTLKIQDARLLRVCTACVQIRISQVHGYSECTVIREVRVVLCLSLRSAAPGALRVSDCCSGSPLRGALRSNTLITLDFFSCSDGNELSPYAKTNADQALNESI